jgi:quercetin dioxygenase-like cupin family protein
MKNYLFALIVCLFLIKAEYKAWSSISENRFKILPVKTNLSEGKEREIIALFEMNQRKIVQLTLRNGTRLESHKVNVPILIQCISGEGELLVPNNETIDVIKLEPGITVSLEPDILHEVVAKPAVSIMLIKFPEESK